MAYLTAGSLPVSKGYVVLPLTGRAVAELWLAVPGEQAPVRPGDALSLAFAEGPTLAMTVLRAGPARGFWRVQAVTGAGKLHAPVAPKFYRDVPAALVFQDILSEVGETPGTVDLPGTLRTWVRRSAPAFAALRALMLRFQDRNWRVLADGTVWAGEELWPSYGGTVRVVEARPERGRYALLPVPDLEPGVVIPGLGRVHRVVQVIEPRRLRTEVWVA